MTASTQPGNASGFRKPGEDAGVKVFSALFGLLLGLTLLKFGNPVVVEKFIGAPANGWELVFNPWPVVWGWWLLGAVTAAGVWVARRPEELPWTLAGLPLVWLVWQFVSATRSINPALSQATLSHFAACVVCFYLGLFSLGRSRQLGSFSTGLIAGFLLVLASGWRQHFGGLKETSDYFFQYVYPAQMYHLPPGLLKKMATNRIFATLFYPNTLAGVILMLLPVALAALASARGHFTAGARGFMMAVVGVGALAALYWSGSKGGWLLMLVTGFAAMLFVPLPRKLKWMLVAGGLALGLAGFGVKYAGFFQRGATSVVARFDYWEAAVKTFRDKPVFGSGPGTFGDAYARIKRPESEMAMMTHNDYLEQASDSGLAGFLAYVGFMAWGLAFTRRKIRRDWMRLAVWLGLLGWGLQSFVEFGLYIPAIAWPGFALFGWLLAQPANEFDSGKTAG